MDLREQGRVKVARTVATGTPGLAGVIASDWRKAAMFYARFGIMEGMLRPG